LVQNTGDVHSYKSSAWAVTRSVSQHPTKISGLKIKQKITVSLITWFTHWSWEPGRYVLVLVDSEGRFPCPEIWSSAWTTFSYLWAETLVQPVCIYTEVVLEYSSNLILYCRVDRNKSGASGPRGGCARDFVNFREKIHASRARGAARRVWQLTPPGSQLGTLLKKLRLL
jgi:hypothetical protein